MIITKEADYALRVILNLSKREFGERVESKVLSEEESIPLRFLLKLLRKLTHKGLIKSFRGTNGGYSLNKVPNDISFKEVIEAIDGPIFFNRCLQDVKLCNAQRGNKCEIHCKLNNVQKMLIEELEKLNFKN